MGTADTFVPPAQGFALYGAARGPKELLVVPGAGHMGGYYRAPELYRQTVLAFLGEHLG